MIASGLGLRHRPRDLIRVKRVGDDRRRAHRAQGIALRLAPRHPNDRVPGCDQPRNELLPERPSGASDEDLHGISFHRCYQYDEMPSSSVTVAAEITIAGSSRFS